MDPTLISIVAAAVSAVAAIASVIVAVSLGRRAGEFSAEQARLSAFTTAAEWRRDLTGWASEAVDVLSEAIHLCEGDSGAGQVEARELLTWEFRISSLIDRGRFFLPNVRTEEHGTRKPIAYRGFRHAALDPLVAAHRVLSTGETGRYPDRRSALNAMRREFVSALQRILDPQSVNEEIAKLIARGSEKHRDDPTLGGLLPNSIPPGADAVLYDPPSS